MTGIRLRPVENCRICSSALGLHSISVETQDPAFSGVPFLIRECPVCSHGNLSPAPNDDRVSELYVEAKGQDRVTMARRDFDQVRGGMIDKLKDHQAKKSLKRMLAWNSLGQSGGIRVLDYACGNGRYSNILNDLGCEVVAADFQDTRPSVLHSSVPYLHVKDLEDHRGCFDWIFLRHVLEHSPHPDELLTELRLLLAGGGRLYVEVPNLNAGLARIFRSLYAGWYVPRHLSHFTAASLEHALGHAGLTGESGFVEMPYMGNQLMIVLRRQQYSLVFQMLGAVLHPFQWIIGRLWEPTCLAVIARPRQ